MKNNITSANQIGPNYLRSIPSDVTAFSAKYIYEQNMTLKSIIMRNTLQNPDEKKRLVFHRQCPITIFVMEDHTSKVNPVKCFIQILISFPITTELWIFSILIAMCVLQQARTHSVGKL